MLPSGKCSVSDGWEEEESAHSDIHTGVTQEHEYLWEGACACVTLHTCLYAWSIC